MNINNDKIAAIESAMNQIEKQFGKGSIMKLGAAAIMDIQVIPTGCLSLDIAVNEELVQKGRAWFSYKDIKLGQGRENSKLYLKNNPDLAIEIENLIREKYNLPLIKTVIK